MVQDGWYQKVKRQFHSAYVALDTLLLQRDLSEEGFGARFADCRSRVLIGVPTRQVAEALKSSLVVVLCAHIPHNHPQARTNVIDLLFSHHSGKWQR